MPHVLIYHDITPPGRVDEVGFPGAVAARYKLDPERFRRHLDALAAADVTIGLVADGQLPEAALTFDDGGASALDAAGELERRGWRGHFFVTTGRLGTPGFLDPAGVRELVERGHAVGSHSVTHPPYMGRLARGDIDREWQESRAALGDLLGEPPATASVPGGFLTRGLIDSAAAAGYRVLMTSEPSSRVRRHGDLLVLGRYSIWSTTSPSRAAAFARGSVPARARSWVEWNVKQRAKRLSPGAFEALRRVRARAR
jgi:peptidoglycan/xylan/chitin deacetylase (PgdA/CDA1 family)